MTDVRTDAALLYRLEGALTELSMVGLVSDGVRMVNRFAGTLTVGDLIGGHVDGVDYFRVRPDGVGVVDAQEMLTVDGHRVAVEVHGYALPPPNMPPPPPEVLTSPEFSWPDVPFTIEAFAIFQTGAPALGHLNRLIVAHTGSVNMATRELVIDARPLEHRQPAPGVAPTA